MTQDEPTAVYHGLAIERDIDVPLRDAAKVVADVFRPDANGRFGTIMTMGPYSKDIHFKDWSTEFDYDTLLEQGPYMRHPAEDWLRRTGGQVRGSARAVDPVRSRLAALLAPQAGPGTLDAVSPAPHAR
jgi:hypothetical protein